MSSTLKLNARAKRCSHEVILKEKVLTEGQVTLEGLPMPQGTCKSNPPWEWGEGHLPGQDIKVLVLAGRTGGMPQLKAPALCAKN